MAIDQPAEIPGIIAQHAQPGDMVVIMGAGTCTQWANALPQQLATSATREDEEGET